MSACRSRCTAVAVALFVAGCGPRAEKAEPAPAPPEPSRAPAPAPILLIPPPALTRADIVAAAGAAASAYAAGAPYPGVATKLAGREVSVRLPFGCRPGAGPGAQTAAVLDPKAGTLRLTVKPQTWTDDPRIRALVGSADTEAVEGFWIRWPWLDSEACPAGAPPVAGAPVAAESLGLAQVFAADGSRLRRRGDRGYETTIKAPAAMAMAGGFRLVLRGRVADPEDHRPVRCVAENQDVRPFCVILLDIDHVAFATAEGETLAEWDG